MTEELQKEIDQLKSQATQLKSQIQNEQADKAALDQMLAEAVKKEAFLRKHILILQNSCQEMQNKLNQLSKEGNQ